MADDEIDLSAVPEADYVRVYFCGNPECQRPHTVLFRNRRPFAQFVLPDMRADGTSFLTDLQHAALKSAMLRD